jgi:uncharacterized protein (TIGR02391 family)
MNLVGLSDQEICDLDLESLAYLVLEHLITTNEWNTRNFLVGQEVVRRALPAQEALVEALNWLLSNGLAAMGKPGQSASESMIVTRRGRIAAKEGLAKVRAGTRLNVELHPLLVGARTKFLGGDFEFAVLEAMRAVEIRTRDLAGLGNSDIGVNLMQQAWSPKAPGPLVDTAADGGEQLAVLQLFAGAVGLFKNPLSHRQIDYADATEAAEAVMLADLLMRLLDKTAARLGK